MGQEASDIGRLCELMRLRSMRWGMNGLPVVVQAGIEMALWDLNGKRLNVPAYELMGGRAQERLRLYASAYASLYPPQETANKVLHYVDQGFTAVKLATGFWGHDRTRETPLSQIIEQECAKLAAIRGAVGSRIDLALDHHGANNPYPWPGDVAIPIIRALDEFHLMWFEQPCASDDLEGYARLKERVATPISGAEEATTVQQVQAYLDMNALDIIQPDVAWMGVAATQRAFALAQARGVRTTLHVAGTGVTRAANYHFAFSQPGCFIVEYQVEQNPLFDELLVEPLNVRDGYLFPPTAPGFGVQLKPETVARYPFQAREWAMSHQPGGVAQGRIS
jgi:L-alanine-DL-glutamate epimerase-like enolase superfamily enzyme